MKKYNLINKRFGKLTALFRTENIGIQTAYRCLCDCGNFVSVRTTSLACGVTTSCGCKAKERLTTHKMSLTKEYRCWASMKQRCYNKNNVRYKNYGGRKIFICDRWNKFENFLFDMGSIPTKNHSIDRINNNDGYYKENCRWATRTEQQQNKTPYPINNKLPKGDNHWTRKDRNRARVIGIKNIKKSHKKGEENNNAKMTIEAVKKMRDIYNKNPNIAISALGNMFGIKREQTRKIIKEIIWLC